MFSPGADATLVGKLLVVDPSTVTTDGAILSLTSASLILGGSLLTSENSIITADTLLNTSDGSTFINTAGPVIKINGGSLTADALASTDGAGNVFNLTGTVLDLSNTTVTLRAVSDEPAVNTDISAFNLGVNEPFIRMANSTLTLTGAGEPLVDLGVDAGAPINQSGVALIANPSTVNIQGPLLDLGGVNLTDLNSQIQLTDTTVTQTGSDSLIEVSGLPVTVAGPLLQSTDSNITTAVDLLDVSGSLTSKGGAALLQFDPSTIITGDDFVDVLPGGSLKLSGPLFTDVGGTFSVGDEFFKVDDGNVTGTGTAAFIQLDGSTVNTVQEFVKLDNSSKVSLKGPLLKNVGSTYTLGEQLLQISDGSSFTSTTSDPLITLSGSTVDTGLDFTRLNDGGKVTLAGPLVSDSGSTFSIADRFLSVSGDGSTFTSMTSSPLITLSGSTVNTAGDFVRIDDSATVNLSGSLLSAGSTLDVGSDLLDVRDGGQLVTSSADPLVLLSGGTHTFTSELIDIRGLSITDQPIKGTQPSFSVNEETASNPIGALFKATNAADITVNTGMFELDNALFEATLPVVDLVGTSTTQTQITSNGTFVDIGSTAASKLVLKGPVIALDKGLITVNNGPLLSLNNGSTMEISGNFLQLSNGSKITVLSGARAAIEVNGAGSALNVTGALLNFANTSGNSFIINNSTAPNLTLSGIPVNEGTSGSINIGATPIINNPGGNTVTVNGVMVGPGPFTGSVISTTNGGTVNITAGGGL